jgi:hypothetical protein
MSGREPVRRFGRIVESYDDGGTVGAATVNPLGRWMIGSQPPYWFEASVDEVEEAWAIYAESQNRWFGEVGKPPVRLDGSLPEVLERVRRTPHTNLVVGTTRGWSASYYNWDTNFHLLHTQTLVPCAAATFYFEPINRPTNAFCEAGRGFSYHREPRSGAEVWEPPTPDRDRFLSLDLEDGRWMFSEYGQPFPFEDVAAYRKSRRATRVTDEMLVRYAEALGVPIREPDVYNGQALVVYRLDRGDGRGADPSDETQRERFLDERRRWREESIAVIDSRIARRRSQTKPAPRN